MSETADYKKTIRLPETSFPMKANLAEREPKTLERWQGERLYEKVLEARRGKTPYVFHDGPPYANGHIHYGHVLNKVLKDIVTKYQLMAGRSTRFVPGWDCHGLPIELNVEKSFGPKRAQVTTAQLRAACRREAEKWVEVQKKEFARLGVFGTWESPYLTMDKPYERGIVEALGAFVKHGIVYRGKKPVHWCSSCRTALAEAEVEYAEHKSPSVYVKFRVSDAQAAALGHAGTPVYALIWTTTPWTLTANMAIAVHPEVEYQLVRVGAELWILAKPLVEAVLKATKKEGEALPEVFLGADLARGGKLALVTKHPFEDRESPLLPAEHVTTEAGTGLVHTAPGHGADDYRLGQRYHLDTYAPLDDEGKYTNEVSREAWRGKHVFEANPLVVELLAETGALANDKGQFITHSYPHCWRCKNPVIFRATTQWFISLDEKMSDGRTLREAALFEIDQMAKGRDTGGQSGWIPSWGRDRIHGMIQDRPDWCISRQRVWGVPIPAMHCKQCSHVDLSEALVAHVADVFGKEGADVWYTKSASELAPAGYACSKCGGKEFDKDPNILDVWFESGASFWSVMNSGAYGDSLGLPVDLYLEGSDQHRGWFHSSLLVGVAMLGRAPYKRVLTHGFVCDDKGRPYSKSEIRRRQEAGEKVEYVEISELLKQQGAELLRLWTAYEDYRSDLRFSRDHLKQVSDAYFKVRNTLRFLLGNLSAPVDRTKLPKERDPLDLWAEARTRKYLADVVRAYEELDFRSVYHRTVEICATDWSSFYMDVVKDRLYCDAPDSPRRQSTVAAIDLIARTTIAALAPILCFTADEAWRALPGEENASVFTRALLTSEGALSAEDEARLAATSHLDLVRNAVNAALEPLIKSKEIPHRREAAVSVVLPSHLSAPLDLVTRDLAEALTVASVDVKSGETLSATVTRTTLPRCERCWRHRPDVGNDPRYKDLCTRCAPVVASLPALVPAHVGGPS